MPVASGPTAKEEAEFRARDDLRTLSDAQKIRKDKSRFDAAMAEAKRQMKALESLGDE